MNFEDPTLLFDLGGGVIAGIAVGLALKAATRLALIIVGVTILGMFGLMKAGLISIHWDAVSHSLEGGAHAAGNFLSLAVTEISAQLVGFSGGLLMGFRWKS